MAEVIGRKSTKKQAAKGRKNGERKRKSLRTIADSPSSHTRGERKKISLNDKPLPIEQGGDYP
jgi:hypothetical protein